MPWCMDWRLWKDSRYLDGERLRHKHSQPAPFCTHRFDLPFKRQILRCCFPFEVECLLSVPPLL